jgi:two-component system LytT family sensor kinase
MTKLTPKSWFYNLIPALIWFLLLILPFINPPANIPEAMRHRFLPNIFITNTLLLFLFYIHTYLLYPLLKSKGWLIYLLSLCGLLICYWLQWWFFRRPPMRPPSDLLLHGMPVRRGIFNAEKRPPFGLPMGRGPGGFITVLSPIIVLLCSYCYRIILDNNIRLENVKERETVHLRTELSFLRSQINPHFLFNVLNNLTLLARKKSELMEPAIVNLSQLMRYMLYESDENKVSLNKEVAYLKSYIELQRLRFGKEVTINADMDGDYFFILYWAHALDIVSRKCI